MLWALLVSRPASRLLAQCHGEGGPDHGSDANQQIMILCWRHGPPGREGPPRPAAGAGGPAGGETPRENYYHREYMHETVV